MLPLPKTGFIPEAVVVDEDVNVQRVFLQFEKLKRKEKVLEQEKIEREKQEEIDKKNKEAQKAYQEEIERARKAGEFAGHLGGVCGIGGIWAMFDGLSGPAIAAALAGLGPGGMVLGIVTAATIPFVANKVAKVVTERLTAPRTPPVTIRALGESIETTKAKARKKLNMDFIEHYNIAFAGSTGAGKSTLLNSLMNLRETDRGSAPVGEEQTTSSIKCYSHPCFPNDIKMWDVPGAGTLEYPTATYFKDMMLYAFCGVVLIYDKRLPEWFKPVAEELGQYRVPFVVVRTKADIDIKSKMRRGLTQAQAVDDLRLSFKKELDDVNLSFKPLGTFLLSGQELIDGNGICDEKIFKAFVVMLALGKQ